jgi:hypothetical protein
VVRRRHAQQPRQQQRVLRHPLDRHLQQREQAQS